MSVKLVTGTQIFSGSQFPSVKRAGQPQGIYVGEFSAGDISICSVDNSFDGSSKAICYVADAEGAFFYNGERRVSAGPTDSSLLFGSAVVQLQNVGGSDRVKIDGPEASIETNKIGFYGAAPIVQPAGVAVTDVAIHAALVALGLIV